MRNKPSHRRRIRAVAYGSTQRFNATVDEILQGCHSELRLSLCMTVIGIELHTPETWHAYEYSYQARIVT